MTVVLYYVWTGADDKKSCLKSVVCPLPEAQNSFPYILFIFSSHLKCRAEWEEAVKMFLLNWLNRSKCESLSGVRAVCKNGTEDWQTQLFPSALG